MKYRGPVSGPKLLYFADRRRLPPEFFRTRRSVLIGRRSGSGADCGTTSSRWA